jgi:hypothetical protein
MRFRFFDRASTACPSCGRSWLTEHMFSCPAVEPILARNGLSYALFCDSMREGRWAEMIVMVFEVLTTWKSWAVFCAITDDDLNQLFSDRQMMI